MVLDILKGTLAVVLGREIFYGGACGIRPDLYKILCAVAAVCGHNWPVYLGFRGGKGVATSAGALLGLAPALLLGTALAWAAVAKVSGYVSVASMAAALIFAAMTFVFKTSPEMKIFGAVMAALLIVKHRGNIARLLAGTEPKIGQAKTPKAGDVLQ